MLKDEANCTVDRCQSLYYTNVEDNLSNYDQ